jgi:hypothetical protein
MASQQTVPSAILVAVTDQARSALGNKSEVRITEFPFNVGRESRMGRFEKLKAEIERRLGGVPPVNDLYLVEPLSHSLHISREHFAIGHVEGQYVLVDRESACGTSVGATRVGSDEKARRVNLQDGDLIVVGAASSPYVFRFQIEGLT